MNRLYFILMESPTNWSKSRVLGGGPQASGAHPSATRGAALAPERTLAHCAGDVRGGGSPVPVELQLFGADGSSDTVLLGDDNGALHRGPSLAYRGIRVPNVEGFAALPAALRSLSRSAMNGCDEPKATEVFP